MGLQSERQRQIGGLNGSIVSVNTRHGSPYQQDDVGDSQGGKITRCSIPDLPQDIWHLILSLVPLRDAARAACLCRTFLCSWRCRPNLTLNRIAVISEEQSHRVNYGDIIDRILRNRTGTGLKMLNLNLYGISRHYLDSWLQVAVTPTIEELTVVLCTIFKKKYNFPCSLLSNGVGNSIRYLELGFCAFRPTAELVPLRNLARLNLRCVRVTGDELERFLSNCLALEQLDLYRCKEIIFLKLPHVLQKFSCLRVLGCWKLRVVESKAPNLSSLRFNGDVKLSLGEPLQMKRLSIVLRPMAVYYARAELPCIMPNLETLDISSSNEVVDTPLFLPTKFLHLKYLSVSITSGDSFSPSYDYFSLISFLDASPSLATLILDVSQESMEHKSVHGDSSGFRPMPQNRHCHLKNVKITGYSSAKSLVELTHYILKNAVSLECLTLDTLYGFRCSGEDSRGLRCLSKSNSFLREAAKAVAAIRMYIEDKVPTTVKLTVVEPCTRCHAIGGRGTERPYDE